MSRKLRNFLADLFGKKERSDCTIIFYVPTSDTPREKPAGIKSSACAHLLVLCGASPRFSAQVDRWTEDKEPSNRHGPGAVLRVPLDSEDALPYALSTIRFMYTDKLEGLNTVDALLRVRQLAAYLQVEGCVEACDTALKSLVGGTPERPLGTESSTTTTRAAGRAAALSGVINLYMSRSLLDEDQGEVGKLLHVCREQLDAAWALSDLDVRKQVEGLPLGAMEALLQSDTFSTDDESSVLLLVACWLQASGSLKTDKTSEACSCLCKLVRLSHLPSTFLHVVLPSLSWFPITPGEHRFLCDYAHAPPLLRAQMAAAAAGMYDCGSAWYTAAVRPRSSMQSLRSFDWYITRKSLQTALSTDAAAQSVTIDGTFVDGSNCVVAGGLKWCPYVQYDKGTDMAGVFLSCQWPQSLGLSDAAELVALVQPGAVTLSVDKGRTAEGGSAGNVAWKMSFGPETFVRVGWSCGNKAALPLQLLAATEGEGKQTPGQGRGDSGGSRADVPASPLLPDYSSLTPWEPYLTEDSLWGSLSWAS
ncbi:hypothetical protein VOLCADRAFT_100219 [Volvox carteri f. nagariensis]|uniref:BACK domain-containing protein n=1 Tax=Volvox carteri f. nagariensis TaxID=3068 RepID=D8UJQ8_VOLCA|nr:uncharacterized protein VOLCADRAFT_100219 [Volvox carteri f. nagariensis]EFJ40033.1 hypothetical protein VOLCADRAFT_100219 [Volvox carteri f. nagariensis]|eukprot:XP_002958902.1 hypothetical protein VOLCADRAFT_100219 [Volvox carteri f. nagariensis]